MGNISSYIGTNKEIKLNEVQYIIRNTIHNIMKKQIYKPEIEIDPETNEKNTVYKYLDMDKMESYQYKSYYLPYDYINKYLKLNKKEYYLLLFRIIQVYVEGYKINDALYDMYLNKEEKLTSLSNLFYENKKYEKIGEKCNLNNVVNILDNTKKVEFGVVIQVNEEKEIFEKFKNYYLKIHNSLDDYNKYYKILDNMKFTLPTHVVTRNNIYYLNNIEMNDEEYFILFTFFTFLILNCKKNNLFINFALYDNSNPNANSDSAHKNMLFLQKKYDLFYRINEINIYHYEPHGTESGFSYKEMDIENIYEKISKRIKILKNNLLYNKFLININFIPKKAVCKLGAQALTASEDIGYCMIFSTFWYNCFLNVLDNINQYDNKYSYKLNFLDKLSNIPVEEWINEIDYNITLYKEFEVKYPQTEYEINKLLSLMKYVIIEDFKSLKNNLNIKSVNTSENFYNYIKKQILYSIRNNNKKTFKIEDFFEMYYEELKKLNLNSNLLDSIKNKKNKLKTAEYFSIFVNFAKNLYKMLSYNNREDIDKYINKDDRKNISNYIVNDTFFEFVKRFFENRPRHTADGNQNKFYEINVLEEKNISQNKN